MTSIGRCKHCKANVRNGSKADPWGRPSCAALSRLYARRMARPSRLSLAFALAVAATAACSERQPSTEAPRHERPAPAPRIDPKRAQALVAAGGIVVDVREASELAETGKLRSALHLPLATIRAEASKQRIPPELQGYKRRPVILYCRSGRRAGEAAEILRRLGVTDVYNLGGFEEAAQAGYPVEPGTARGSSSLAPGD